MAVAENASRADTRSACIQLPQSVARVSRR